MSEMMGISPFAFYTLLVMCIGFMGGCGWLFWLVIKKQFLDIIIFIDKSNRWELVYTNLKYKKRFEYMKKTYFLTDSTILNYKGKSLYIFSENKPQPLTISYNKASWLDSESLLALINNDLVKKLVESKNKALDILLMFGSLGGILAGISSVIILLIQTGVIGKA